jgi:hypothetical protein
MGRQTALAMIVVLACGNAGCDLFSPGQSATRTWSGELALGGLAQTVTVQLHRRDDGSILGYVVGGTSGRTVTEGNQANDTLTFELEIADPLLTRTVSISGTVSGNALDGDADEGGVVTPIHWTSIKPELLERRFLFAASGGGDPGPPVELSVVQRHGNNMFVNGAFVGRTDCSLFACGGAVTAFDASDDGLGNEVVKIDLATGGGCPGSGSLEATFNSTTKFYAGEYSFTDCNGIHTGDLIGTKSTRTTSHDAADVLASFDQLATALESGASLGPADVPLSADYLHLGVTRDDRLMEFNDEIATYADIGVALNRFRNLYTVNESDILPDLATAFGVDFSDRRTGDPGGGPTVYRDVDTSNGADELKFLNREGSDWLIYGNHVTHDLPIAGYSFGPEQVIAPTAGGDVFVSIGPWGAHSGPHTGHLEGNAKGDWMGLYARSLDQLQELAGDGDMVCEAGETCGIAEADLDARIVDYVTPAAPFTVNAVTLERIEPPGVYYGTDEHWRVRGRVAYYTYDFIHLREISGDLRNAMLAAGYVDPWTVHMPSDNLITGEPVMLSTGDTIARPQTVAEEVPGHPGFYRGKFGVPESPWQQMEFFTANSETDRSESYYTWLAPALEASLAAVLEAEALDPLSFRYHQTFLTERRWQAEMALSNQDWMDRDDYSTLFSALGGWWENTASPCDGMSVDCDELFSIFPIRKDTALYSAGLYESADVSYLAIHAYSDELPPTQFGEVITPADPDPSAGTLIIKWRNFGGSDLGYQGLGYRLDTAGRTLRIAWGAMAPSEAAVVLPAVPDNTDPCDGATLTCHNHNRPGG